MRGEDCRFRILQFLDTGGAAGFEEIIKAVGAARRTTNKHLGALYKKGLVAKLYGKTGKYYLTKEGKAEAERQKRRREISAGIAEIDDINELQRLKRELTRAKNQLRIQDLEGLGLPARAVHKKLLSMDFTNKDLYDVIDEKIQTDPNIHDNYQIPYRLIRVGIGPYFDKLTPNDIEIDLIGEKAPWFPIGPRRSAWVPLTEAPLKGYMIVGAYKELLQLLTEEFENELLDWKERFELTDADWEIVGPEVREMMKHDCLPPEIIGFLAPYTYSKTLEGQTKLREIHIKRLGKEKGEEMARKEIEYYQRLRREAKIEK